jgi:hypothetical protein
MSEKTESIEYPVCLVDGRVEGRIVVDLDSFLRFNAWIDEQLIALESRMAAFRRPRRAMGGKRHRPLT